MINHEGNGVGSQDIQKRFMTNELQVSYLLGLCVVRRPAGTNLRVGLMHTSFGKERFNYVCVLVCGCVCTHNPGNIINNIVCHRKAYSVVGSSKTMRTLFHRCPNSPPLFKHINFSLGSAFIFLPVSFDASETFREVYFQIYLSFIGNP